VTIREPLCGELVCLAPLTVEDAPAWERWMNDPETIRYLYAPGDHPRQPQTEAALREWGRTMLADPRRIVFGLREREGGASIGDSRLAPGPGSRTARFSIMIGDRRFRGLGMGTEATWLVCRYGFDQLGLEEIRLEVDPQNAAAVRAYESVGFVHGRRRSMRLQRGGLVAAAVSPQ
jgi:RimJ/RimL family protein N-acetyltransferase